MASALRPTGSSRIILCAAGRTDRGRVRENNEDAFLIRELSRAAHRGQVSSVFTDIGAGNALVVVSDGMGGANAGEVASDMVVRLVADAFAYIQSPEPTQLRRVIASVSQRILEAAREPGRHGMGATMTALLFIRDAAFVIQVGDSRAYVLREGKLLQLTRDQTRVQMLLDRGALTPEEASRAPDRNVILQAMGSTPRVRAVLARFTLRRGDRLLVCSDGLSNKVPAADLALVLARHQPFEAIAQALVDDANANGGQDNITAVVCGLEGSALREPQGADPSSDLHSLEGEESIGRAPAKSAGVVTTQDAAFEHLIAAARGHSHRGEYTQGLDAARRAVARARDLRSTELTVRATEREANTLSLSGRGGEAVERLGSILSIVSERPRRLSLTDAQVAHSVVCAHLDWVSVTGFIGRVPIERRFDVLDRTEALVVEIGRPEWLCAVLGMRATLLASQGRYDEALLLGAETLRTFTEGSPGSTLASHRQQHADILFEARRPADAEREYTTILTDPRRSVRDEKSAHVGLARCAARRGDLAVAKAHAEEAVRIAGPLGDSAVCGALHALADVLEKSGEIDHAAAVADRLVEKAQKTGSPQRLFYAVRTQIDLALNRADGEGARGWLEKAQELASLLDGTTGEKRFGAQLQGRRARVDRDDPLSTPRAR